MAPFVAVSHVMEQPSKSQTTACLCTGQDFRNGFGTGTDISNGWQSPNFVQTPLCRLISVHLQLWAACAGVLAIIARGVTMSEAAKIK
jgi:hypothetical protein